MNEDEEQFSDAIENLNLLPASEQLAFIVSTVILLQGALRTFPQTVLFDAAIDLGDTRRQLEEASDCEACNLVFGHLVDAVQFSVIECGPKGGKADG